MKKFLPKLRRLTGKPRFEKLLLIAVPCLAVLLAALILLPGIRALSEKRSAAASEAPAASAPPTVEEAAVLVSAPPASQGEPSAAPAGGDGTAEEVETFLRASSGERDLTITVCDGEGRRLAGESFGLSIVYPDGRTYGFSTTPDGTCYLTRLEAGEYRISMDEHPGYTAAEPVVCSVKEELVYEHIDNIGEVIEIEDVADLPPEEVDSQETYSAPDEAVAEELVTRDGAVREETYPILDANGNQTYTYTYQVGENGCLLFRDSGVESRVMPVDEDGDGQLDFGQTFYIPEGQEGPAAQGYYKTEILFHPDNTPVETYAIDAEPRMGTSSSPLGWREINGKTYYYDQDGVMATGLKKIDGKLYYFDCYGARARSVGIDVSYFDGDINWPAVKAQGIDFAIIRVGGRSWERGTIYYDSRTVEYFTEAKKAGLKVGAYFYSTAVTGYEAVQEATVALDVLNGTGLDLPLFFDTEYSGMYPEGRADTLNKAQRGEVVRAFCETVRNSSGYSAGVYSGEYFIKEELDYQDLAPYPLWLASYTSGNALPGFAHRYDIWQFTDRGVLDGIDGYVDMNVVF